MARIACDIDSTLYDFETPARDAFLRLADKYNDKSLFRGAYDPWIEWRSPADSCGLDIWLEAIALVHDSDVILSRTPFDGAVETCQALEAYGHELLFISNRAVEADEPTRQWLEEWGFLKENAQVVCTDQDKKSFLAECQYLIDDRPKTSIEFVYDWDWRLSNPDDPRKAFVKEYSYNQNLSDIPNLYLAHTWSGLNFYMVRKGVLPEPAYKALAD